MKPFEQWNQELDERLQQREFHVAPPVRLILYIQRYEPAAVIKYYDELYTELGVTYANCTPPQDPTLPIATETRVVKHNSTPLDIIRDGEAGTVLGGRRTKQGIVYFVLWDSFKDGCYAVAAECIQTYQSVNN